MRVLSATLIAALVLSVPLASCPEALDDHGSEPQAVSGASCNICFNEIMANPSGPEQGLYPDGEWLELINRGQTAVSLQGWYIEDAGGWKHYINQSTWVGFESLQVPWTLEVEGYAIVAENNVGTLRMNNGGESLLLIDSEGNEVDSVTIDNSDSGVSKVRLEHNSTDDQFSNSLSPTPGYANHGNQSGFSDEGTILFTRVMPVGVNGFASDWIEIQNIGDSIVDLSGWKISRNRSFSAPWASPWISTFRDLIITPNERVILTSDPTSVPDYMANRILDGEVVMDTMPRLVDSGTALQLLDKNGGIIDALVYDGGNADIEGWIGPSINARGEGSPGLILSRGDGCSDLLDSDTSAEWQVRSYRIGASTFCPATPIYMSETDGIWPSIGPDGVLGDLLGWIDGAQSSLRVHIYEFLSPDVTHALLDALDRGIEVTLVLEEGILDSSSVSNSQRGHASALDEAGALVYWMVDPSGMSSPFTYIHSKIILRDSDQLWISSGNIKDSSLPPDGESGNREWSVFIDSEEVASIFSSWLSWDEDHEKLYIREHGSWAYPSIGWELPTVSETQSTDPTSREPALAGQASVTPILCPDNCLIEIIAAIDASVDSLEVSAQYLDVDWYWGEGDNSPLLGAIKRAAERGVDVRILLNAFYADDETWGLVDLVNADWNDDEGLNATARLMSTSDRITKLHNKGMIVDGETVLVGSMNWGSSAMLRNREHGAIINSQSIASQFLASFNEDWDRVDERTDTDGDTLPDMWELIHGLDRDRASVAGTALSEQSLDPDGDGLDNRMEFLLGGEPFNQDTDGDCIRDGDEWEFATQSLRPESAAIASGDVNQNGVDDGLEFGCTVEGEIVPDPSPEENNNQTTDEDEGPNFVNIRDDPLSAQGAKFLLALTLVSAALLITAGLALIRKPRASTTVMLVDDQGYKFGDDSTGAILAGTRFDVTSDDARDRPMGKDDGSHGEIVLDGFGFNDLSRDEVQWRLDNGASIDEIKREEGDSQ